MIKSVVLVLQCDRCHSEDVAYPKQIQGFFTDGEAEEAISNAGWESLRENDRHLCPDCQAGNGVKAIGRVEG